MACLLGLDAAKTSILSAGVSTQQIDSWKERWLVSSTCRGCGLPVSDDRFDVWTTYWKSMFAPSHPECVKDGMRQEAFYCQTIDSDCNDCKHFWRGEKILVECRKVKGGGFHGEIDKTLFLGSYRGACLKFNRPTTAHVNFCSGHDCFEHRRSV